jgi:nucleoside-diphosphate-sugar epimerase
MTIAIAGSGDLTRYLVEEFLAANVPVALLVRTTKPHFTNVPNLTQLIVDYTSIDSLTSALNQAGATTLISTILSYDTSAFVTTQKNLIAAAQASKTVTRFIPSEYGVDIAKYPDQPGFYWETREPIREVLRNQTKLEWTLVCCGWLMDYILPPANRYMKDIGDAFPINLAEKRMVIPGTGSEKVDWISARDLARGIVSLVKVPKGQWGRYIYLSGERMSSDELAAAVKEKYPDIEFEVEYLSLRVLVNAVRDAKDDFERIAAEYKIVIPSASAGFEEGVIERDRERYFKDVEFRTVREVLDAAEQGVIV